MSRPWRRALVKQIARRFHGSRLRRCPGQLRSFPRFTPADLTRVCGTDKICDPDLPSD